jgi:hypothetical protein
MTEKYKNWRIVRTKSTIRIAEVNYTEEGKADKIDFKPLEATDNKEITELLESLTRDLHSGDILNATTDDWFEEIKVAGNTGGGEPLMLIENFDPPIIQGDKKIYKRVSAK